MKTLDVIVAVLIVIGGLNWGLVGFFNFDLVGTVFGHMSALSRLIYCAVGLSAVYYVFQWKSMQKRAKRK